MEEANRFYEWLLKIKNIHVSNSESMAKAFGIVIANSNDLKNKTNKMP